jgi:hypothetical protein
MLTRIDWFRILADLRMQGLSLYAVSDETGIPRKTLDGYRNGGEPRHSDGELLLALWEKTMLPPVPMTPDRTRRNRRETAQGKA